jgi:enamine deaminase RidA (YjgF/YER057c/UK114 family)
MPRQNISSGSPFEKPIGFSRAVRTGERIVVAGTAPIAPDGTTACPGDMYGQTRRCLEIIGEAIEAAGGQLHDVVRTRVLLTDADRWQEAARAHGEVFGAIRPACTFVEVQRLIDPDWLVEIEADAMVCPSAEREA